MKPTPRVVSLFSLLAIVTAVLGHVSPASAVTEVVNVPAVAFLAGITGDVARAPVKFTTPGLQICHFRMWAHDNVPTDATARLVRKRITTDKSSSFGPAPETIASVSSQGASDTMRRFSTVTVSVATVSEGYFYWVELDSGTIQVSGFRIEAKTVCG